MTVRRLTVVAGVVALSCACASSAWAQVLLDRVVARVNGAIILLTDVRAAVGLGVIEAVPDSPDAVEQMVQRALLLDEVERFPPPEPAAAAIDAETARLRAQAGPPLDGLQRATGFGDDQVRILARDRLRIQAYLDQRFGTAAPLGEEQVLQYYRDHPDEFTRDGQRLPFEQVQEVARERAGLERRRRTIGQWLGDLRARAEVTLVGDPARPALGR